MARGGRELDGLFGLRERLVDVPGRSCRLATIEGEIGVSVALRFALEELLPPPQPGRGDRDPAGHSVVMRDVESQKCRANLIFLGELRLECAFLELEPERRLSGKEGGLGEGLQIGTRQGTFPVSP